MQCADAVSQTTSCFNILCDVCVCSVRRAVRALGVKCDAGMREVTNKVRKEIYCLCSMEGLSFYLWSMIFVFDFFIRAVFQESHENKIIVKVTVI